VLLNHFFHGIADGRTKRDVFVRISHVPNLKLKRELARRSSRDGQHDNKLLHTAHWKGSLRLVGNNTLRRTFAHHLRRPTDRAVCRVRHRKCDFCPPLRVEANSLAGRRDIENTRHWLYPWTLISLDSEAPD